MSSPFPFEPTGPSDDPADHANHADHPFDLPFDGLPDPTDATDSADPFAPPPIPGTEHLDAAWRFFRLGRYDEAHAALHHADQYPDLRMEVVIRKLQLNIAQENWIEAASFAEALCDIDPDDPRFFLDMAFVLYQLGRPEDAVNFFYWGPRGLDDFASSDTAQIPLGSRHGSPPL